MRKQYKLLNRGDKIHILRWNRGLLFGPEWDAIASFDNRDGNLERCKRIIQLLNECDKHTEQSNDNDRA